MTRLRVQRGVFQMAAGVPRFELQRPEGSTGDVDYWTRTDVRETKKSHVNYVIADTMKWEQQAGYYIEKHIFASMSPWSRQQKLAHKDDAADGQQSFAK